jgi:hypothetical protein
MTKPTSNASVFIVLILSIAALPGCLPRNSPDIPSVQAGAEASQVETKTAPPSSTVSTGTVPPPSTQAPSTPGTPSSPVPAPTTPVVTAPAPAPVPKAPVPATALAEECKANSGIWRREAKYLKNELVVYKTQAYRALFDNSMNTPDASSYYWKREVDCALSDAEYCEAAKSAWTKTASYKSGDMVAHKSAAFQALLDNSGNAPDTATFYWVKLASCN